MDLVPRWLVGWFWLFAAAIMAVNAALVYARSAPLVRAGLVSSNERRRFALGLAAWTVGFCLAVQVVVWLTGEGRPECLAAFPPDSAASVATTALTLVAWAALLGWIWRGRGADVLARFAPAFVPGRPAGRPANPAQVRRLVTVLVAVSVVGSMVASRIAPAPTDCRDRIAVVEPAVRPL
jgi:hypothetical protein